MLLERKTLNIALSFSVIESLTVLTEPYAEETLGERITWYTEGVRTYMSTFVREYLKIYLTKTFVEVDRF